MIPNSPSWAPLYSSIITSLVTFVGIFVANKIGSIREQRSKRYESTLRRRQYFQELHRKQIHDFLEMATLTFEKTNQQINFLAIKSIHKSFTLDDVTKWSNLYSESQTAFYKTYALASSIFASQARTAAMEFVVLFTDTSNKIAVYKNICVTPNSHQDVQELHEIRTELESLFISTNKEISDFVRMEDQKEIERIEKFIV